MGVHCSMIIAVNKYVNSSTCWAESSVMFIRSL